MAFFSELQQLTLKSYTEPQKTPNSKRNFEKKNQSGRHHAPNFNYTTKLQQSKE